MGGRGDGVGWPRGTLYKRDRVGREQEGMAGKRFGGQQCGEGMRDQEDVFEEQMMPGLQKAGLPHAG